jgi:TPR repeat protein
MRRSSLRSRHTRTDAYESGAGVTQDYEVAVRWFRLAALRKNVKAETNLGIMHANGKGVTQNFAEARKWFQLAADHGEIKAQHNLGALYATGRGVPQNYVEAAKSNRSLSPTIPKFRTLESGDRIEVRCLL